jgi:hypothetical protein
MEKNIKGKDAAPQITDGQLDVPTHFVPVMSEITTLWKCEPDLQAS